MLQISLHSNFLANSAAKNRYLMQVELPVKDNSVCNGIYYNFVGLTQVCAGERGKDVCNVRNLIK